MPYFTPREPPTVEAYRLPLDKVEAIGDSMWLWLLEKDMPTRHRIQEAAEPGTWVVLSRGGNGPRVWSTMSDEDFRATYKPLGE